MNNRYNESYSSAFGVVTAKLIDGYVGQVMFGGDIVHQTEVLQTDEEAWRAANNATVSAVKKLFV